MATVTFGKSNWDKEMGGNSNSDFLNTKEDKGYRMRSISDGPYEFAVHWTTAQDGGKRKVRCAGPGCILCKEGEKAQARFLLEVLYMPNDDDETEKVPKLYEFSPSIYNHIRGLARNKHWGDPRGYDILIEKNSKESPSKMYSVTPLGKSKLTEEDKAKIAEFRDRIENVLTQVTSASTNEEICERLGRTTATEDTWASEPAEPAADGAETDDDWEF